MHRGREAEGCLPSPCAHAYAAVRSTGQPALRAHRRGTRARPSRARCSPCCPRRRGAAVDRRSAVSADPVEPPPPESHRRPRSRARGDRRLGGAPRARAGAGAGAGARAGARAEPSTTAAGRPASSRPPTRPRRSAVARPRQPEPDRSRVEDHATRAFSSDELAAARGDMAPAADPDDLDIAWQDAAKRGEPIPDRPLRQIQPEPAAPPLAPAGSLPDTEPAPTGRRQRRTRRSRRRGGTVMTPPGDVPRGPRTRGRRGPARIAAIVAIVVVIVLLLWLVNAFAQPFGGDGTGSVTVTHPGGRQLGEDRRRPRERRRRRLGLHLLGPRQPLRRAQRPASGRSRPAPRHELRRRHRRAEREAERRGGGAGHHVTIPEGRSRREIAAIAQKAGLQGSYMEATAKAPAALQPAPLRRPEGSTPRGLPVPGDLRAARRRDRRDARQPQLDAFKRQLRGGRHAPRQAQEPHAPTTCSIIASMIEREARVREGAPAHRRRHLQPPPRGHAARHRRDDPLRTNNWPGR